MAKRSTSARNPALDRFGVPSIQRPTPNILDAVIVESIRIGNDTYSALLPGTPHPRNPSARLVLEKPVQGDNQEKTVTRIYCTTRGAQDAYNARITYTEGNASYPIFTRTYFEPRADFLTIDGYAPLAAGSTLTGVTTLTLDTPGGSDYVGDSQGRIALNFAAGAGTGAAGVGQVVEGGIVAAILTVSGTGFTADFAVTAAGGTGAVITAHIQPAACKLVHQEAQPAEEPFESLFMRVTRVYETLPGPEIAETKFDTETYTEQTHYHQRVAAGTAANPVAAVQIASVAVGSPTTITTLFPHDLPSTGTTRVRLAGVTGSTPSVSGDRDATRTGANTFTVPLNVTVAAAPNTGYMSAMKDNLQVIIDSYVKLDEGAGAAAGTLITVAATLPGREMGCPQFDVERSATVDTLRQYVHYGHGTKSEGSSYHGQTIEDSQFVPQSSAWGMLVSKTIDLSTATAISTLSFNDENEAVLKLFRTRVLRTATPDAIGSTYSTSPNRYVEKSEVIPENSIVGVLTTLTMTLPPDRLIVDDTNFVASHNEPIPRLVVIFGSWTIPNPPFNTVGPYLGVDYDVDVKSPAGPALVESTFTVGKDPSPADAIFAVTSGTSRFIPPLNGFSLHDDYTLTETAAGPTTQDIEIMVASDPTPGDYAMMDYLVVNVIEGPLNHPDGIWERKTYKVVPT